MLRNMLKAKRKKTGIKDKFGVRVPRILKKALELDESEGTTYWEKIHGKGNKSYF